VLALSAAGLAPLRTVLAGLPADLPAAVIAMQHIAEDSALPLILQAVTPMQVKFVEDDELLRSNTVYVCPPRVHAVVRPTRTVALSRSPAIRLARPSADWLLESAAASFRDSAIAVILSGRLSDGARGTIWMRRAGAQTIAQTPSTCGFSGMPLAAIRTGCVDAVLPPERIASALRATLRRPGALVRFRAWEDPFAAAN
jgi:two-component system chemotaxis response regulator CheB